MKTVKLDEEELKIEKEFDQFKPAQKNVKNKFKRSFLKAEKADRLVQP